MNRRALSLKARPWLDIINPGTGISHRADLARQFDCDPSEVEARLDAREQMDRFIEARVDYERGMRDLDISLSQLALETTECRIGSTSITTPVEGGVRDAA